MNADAERALVGFTSPFGSAGRHFWLKNQSSIRIHRINGMHRIGLYSPVQPRVSILFILSILLILVPGPDPKKGIAR